MTDRWEPREKLLRDVLWPEPAPEADAEPVEPWAEDGGVFDWRRHGDPGA